MKKARTVKKAAKSKPLKPRIPTATGAKRPARAGRRGRRPSEAEPRISRRLLQSIYDTIPDAVVWTDLDFNILSCNRSVEKILGYQPDELMEQHASVFTFFPPARLQDPQHQLGLARLKRTGHLEQQGSYFQRKDGEIFPADALVAAVKDEQGRPLGWVGAIRDITERRQAEEELRRSRRLLQTIFDALPDAIISTDRELKIVSCNQSVKRVLGYAPEELAGKNYQILIPEFLREDASQQGRLEELITKGYFEQEDFAFQRKNGEVFPANFSVAMVKDEQGRPLGAVGAIRDITERKLVEEELRESEERYRTLVETSPDAITLTDLAGKVLTLNQKALELYGLSRFEEAIGQNSFEYLAPEERARAAADLQKTLTSPGTQRNVFTLVRRDGSSFEAEVNSSVLRDEEGKPKGFVAVTRDITERKRAEEALRESEAKYRLLVNNIPSVTWRTNREGRTTFISSNVAKVYGYTPDEIYAGGESLWFGRIHPEDVERVQRAFAGLFETGAEFNIEYRIRRRDGEWIWLQDRALVHEEGGGEEYAYGMFSDITERKRAEAALRESEERYREIFENVQEFILALDLEGRITSANPQVKQTIGFKTDRLVGKKLAELIEEYLSPHLLEHWNKVWLEVQAAVQKPGDLFREEVFMPITSGELRTFVFIYSGIFREGRLVGYLHIGRDVTESKRAETALRESEERYRILVETSPDAIIMTDLEGNLLMINQQALKLYRASGPAEMIGQNAFSFIAPEDRPQARENQARTLASGRMQSTEYRLSRADGSSYLGELNASMLKDASGQPFGFIGVLRDITERKQAEQALQESEKRYRTLFDDSPISLWEEDFSQVKAYLNQLRQQGIQDLQHYFQDHPEEVFHCATMVRLVDVNKATLALYQAKSKGDLVRGLARTFTPENYDSFLKQLLAAAEGQTKLDIELVNQTLSGEKKNVVMHWVVAPGYEETFSRVLVSIIDVTERKRLEAQILHAQKLESLGILAGGIAHDFNNLLVSILGHSGLALGRTPRDSMARKNLEQIEIAARRAADLTRQMLAYSGRGTFEVRPLDLSKLVEEMAHLLEVAISKQAQIAYHFAPDLPAIEADATQVRQVVMNLITNAAEAIGEQSGTVTVSTGMMQADRAYLSETYLDEDLPEGCFVYLEVSDTGCGLDQGTLAKIFDPFFTTKFTGRGLGLASVLGIVRGHRGAIKVYSEPGQGTTFKVLFPCSAQAARELTAPAISIAGWRGKGTVLVVDDEEEVRVVTRAMLEEFGFTALLAADGREGVELFRRHAEEIVAVLLDQTMPGWSGEETLQHLLVVKPDARIILTSGYNEREATLRFAGQGIASFIQKPYQTLALVQKMREVLEGQKD